VQAVRIGGIIRKPRSWEKRDRTRGRRYNSIYKRPAIDLSATDVRLTPKRYAAEPDPRPPELVAERPVMRGDCAGGERPCPWVSCRNHLYLEVSDAGAIKINFPDLEPWQLERSCALDIADEHPITLEEVGEVMNLTRERIRQVETRAQKLVRGPLRSVR
jgi:hypothetical protein